MDVQQRTEMISENTIIAPVVGESNDLELHTALCAQRYNQLITKLDQVDDRLDSIDTTCVKIREELGKMQDSNFRLYLTWAGAIIAILASTLVATIVK